MSTNHSLSLSTDGGQILRAQLLEAVDRFRRRVQVANAFSAMPRAVAIALLAGLLGQLVAFRFGTAAAGNILMAAGLAVAAGLVIARLLARPTPLRAALEFDLRLGLRERLSTAVELAGLQERVQLWDLQLADAADHAGRVNPREAYPVTITRPELAVALLAAAALAAWNFVPRDWGMMATIVEALAQPQAAEEQAGGGAPRLSPPQAAPQGALSRAERAQLESLRNSLDQLKASSNRDAGAQQERLGAIGEALRRSQAARDAGRRLTGGDYAGAAEALRDLSQSLDKLSSSERKKLQEALLESAAFAEGDQQLVTQFQEAAQALESGRNKSAAEALQQIADRIEGEGSLLASEETLQRRIRELEKSLRQAEGKAQEKGMGAGDEEGNRSGNGEGDAERGGDQQGAGLRSSAHGSEVEAIEGIGTETRLNAEGKLEVIEIDPNKQAPTEKFKRPPLQLGRDIDVSLEPSAGELGRVRARSDTNAQVPLDVVSLVSGYFSPAEGR